MSSANRLLRFVVVVLTAGVFTVLTIIFVSLVSSREPRSASPQARDASPPSGPVARASSDAIATPRPPVVEAPSVLDAPPPPRSVTPDDVPKPADIERQYPGFRKAYDAAFYAAQAKSEARIHRRCLTSLPDSVRQVRWDSIETFKPSDDGLTLVRTGIEFVPGSEQQAPFTRCLYESIKNDGSTKIKMPEETPIFDTVQVHNGGIVYINDYSKEDLARALPELRESAANPALSSDQRAVLQDQLELWECYYNLGMEHRKECLSR